MMPEQEAIQNEERHLPPASAKGERSLGVTIWAISFMAGLGGFLMRYSAIQHFLFSHLFLCGSFIGCMGLTLRLVFVDIPELSLFSGSQKLKHRLTIGTVGAVILAIIASIWIIVWANDGWPHYRTGIVIGVIVGGIAGWLLDLAEN